MELTRDAAWQLLRRYNKEPFHLRHSVTVAAVMEWYARELGYGDEADFWGTVGLLHDIDFEQWPEEHCVKAKQLLGWELDTLLERTLRAMQDQEDQIDQFCAQL